MKKLLIVLSSLIAVTGVFASGSLAHNGHQEYGKWQGQHSSRHAKIWTADLTPPTGETGATGETAPTTDTNSDGGHYWRHGRRSSDKSAEVTVQLARPSTRRPAGSLLLP